MLLARSRLPRREQRIPLPTPLSQTNVRRTSTALKLEITVTNQFRTIWGKRNSSVGAPMGNRSTTPSNTSRTNSPTPAGSTGTAKSDDRAKEVHDQFTYLLFTLTVPSPSLK